MTARQLAAGSSGAAQDCTLDPGESGTGLLNMATVNDNGTEHRDTACALVVPPPPPTNPPATAPDPGQLPATGGDLTPIGQIAFLLVLFGGVVLLVTRRRRDVGSTS